MLIKSPVTDEKHVAISRYRMIELLALAQTILLRLSTLDHYLRGITVVRSVRGVRRLLTHGTACHEPVKIPSDLHWYIALNPLS